MSFERIFREQAHHPVYAKIGIAFSDVLGMVRVTVEGKTLDMAAGDAQKMLEGRARAIMLEKADPYNYGYEPPAWDEIDWEVLKLRLRNPGLPLEVLINGGNGGGKSYFAASRTAKCAVQSENWLVWCFAQDEPNSEAIQQPKLYHYLPAEYKTDKGSIKRTAAAKLNYNNAGGFTDNKFGLHNGTTVEFRFWSKEITTLEGPRPFFAWTDEEVPAPWLEGITRRLLSFAEGTKAFTERWVELLAQKAEDPTLKFPSGELANLYQGVHLITFTPKSGYTPTIRAFVHKATNIREIDAELLPKRDKSGQITGVEKMPKLQYCSTPHRIVYYLHAWDNKHAGNWDAMRQLARGKPPKEIKWWVYGVAENTSGTIFVKFQRAAHVRPVSRLPKKGTWYHVADPCDGKRNWFLGWIKVSPLGECFLAREWPMESDFIPGVGQPGPWAIPAKGKNHDGDAGEGQRSFGGGFDFIREEIERVEMELGKLEWELNGGQGEPARIYVPDGNRIMDARAGNTESLGNSVAKTLIESMAEPYQIEGGPKKPGLDYISAGKDSGAQKGSGLIEHGYKMIEDLLDFDETQAELDPATVQIDPVTGQPNPATGLFNFRGKAPRLYLSETCTNTIFSFENLTGLDGQRAACKDPMDMIRYFTIAEPVDISEDQMQARGGGYY